MGFLAELFSFLRPPSLITLSGSDARKANAILRPIAEKISYTSPDAETELRKRVIPAFEAAAAKQRNEWVYHYMLASYYLSESRYLDAVHTAQRLIELRPTDPRSTYALATSYHNLSHAQFLDEAYKKKAEALREQMTSAFGVAFEFSPERAQAALDALGLSIDQAVEKAAELFEQTRALGVRGEEAKLVSDTLAELYVSFPDIEKRIKTRGRTPGGLFAPVAGTSAGGLLNQAYDHYRKIRYLYLQEDPTPYREELAEIVRLCQMAIDKDPNLGDAYVLLTNALSVAASHWQLIDQASYEYLVTRAAAVIHRWASEPIHDWPRTRHKEVGMDFWNTIAEEISRLEGKAPTTILLREQSLQSVEQNLAKYANTLAPETISPLSYPALRQKILGKQNP